MDLEAIAFHFTGEPLSDAHVSVRKANAVEAASLRIVANLVDAFEQRLEPGQID